MFVYFLYKLYIFSNLFAKCSSQITQFFWWKRHVTKSFVWTFTRTNVYVVKKNVHLFIWNTNTVYLKKNQMAYGMHLNLFCKSLACLCLKCLHIVVCQLSTGASSHVKFFCSTLLFIYVKQGGSESFSSRVSRPLAPLIYVIRSGSYVKRSGPESLDFGKMELERVSLFWKIVNVNTPYLSHYV